MCGSSDPPDTSQMNWTEHRKSQPRSGFKRLEFNFQLSYFDCNLKCSLIGALYFLGLVLASLSDCAKISCKTSDAKRDS